ncbi:trimeric intracellular cation channel family protein [Dasania sp. GY-MA-18]|uniref:Trimeric intracellular cation channel family protein n=1 Tax=Dasania phycosphaerae TaxID=2950436 RepID=A0A9J6RLC6_9GAMM|nr:MULTISPECIES: trimeric intracellular cation channel family protein [Dasania]MCR8922868.1 trimeric intracellular cation channel family protein [Dasania sp. GY-MA-18]MCZ0865299.1 trimeric intracellular cation channel family protein [Dasania phycosphaerae]MCZ0869024.1 trimeric intracellular cation channel family protein [Dasania phycosphaerae]
MLSFESVLYIAGMVGVAVFAISGALAAAEEKLDILSFVLFATVTGIGGGTVRDLFLNVPQVFWVADPFYLYTTIAAAVITYFFSHLLVSISRSLLWMDAAGLALFSVLGTAKAMAMNVDPVVAIAMGMITPTFGSIVRDILLGHKLVLLEPEIYVTAALLGGGGYFILRGVLAIDEVTAILLAVAAAFMLRAAAMIWDLRLPKLKDPINP